MKYITFKTIGDSGNLGSQMQQYASLYAVAKETNREIIFPESSLTTGFGFKFAELLDIPIITKPDDFFLDFLDIRPDDKLIVDKKIFSLNTDCNYNIVNRFDLFHYWHPNYINDILDWNWNPKYLTEAIEIYNTFPKDKETVSIHVRRGDYLLPQHDHFCKLDNGYYYEAISPYFDEIDKYHFVFFSNDIEWCKTNLIESHESITFMEPSSDYVDLILMSLCNHNIIANSSYSWWAAYKNTNKHKQVTCPMNYLKSYSPWASNINTNYYPETWKSINNTLL